MDRAGEEKRQKYFGEFDPGSGRTLAACLTHASRTVRHSATFISGDTGETVKQWHSIAGVAVDGGS